MMLVLLVAALAVSGVGIWASRRWRVLGQAMMALGGLGLIGVLVVQVRQNLFPPPAEGARALRVSRELLPGQPHRAGLICTEWGCPSALPRAAIHGRGFRAKL